jgi:hypothetical protein
MGMICPLGMGGDGRRRRRPCSREGVPRRLSEAAGKPFVVRDVETLAENLRGHAEEGISHVQVVLDPNTLAGVEAYGRGLEVLDRP